VPLPRMLKDATKFRLARFRVVAVLLGTLRMTLDDAIYAYKRIFDLGKATDVKLGGFLKETST